MSYNDLVFYQYLPRARCAVATIAAFAIVEHHILRKRQIDRRTFADWPEVLDFGFSRNLTNSSGERINVCAYLQIPDGARKTGRARRVPPNRRYVVLRGAGGEDRGPLKPLSKLISDIAERYFGPASLLSDLEADVDDGDRALVVALKRATEESWFDTTVAELERKSNSLNLRDFLTHLTGRLAGYEHIDFAPLPLVCEATVATEFHGFAAGIQPKMYAVIREARGWTVEVDHQHDRNLIVRDLLWIGNLQSLFDQDRGESPAYYYSVYDDGIYVGEARLDAQSPTARDDVNIIVTAQMGETHRTHRSLRLAFPLQRGAAHLPLQDGVVFGNARTPDQLAAWKILLLEPSWPSAERLKALMRIALDINRASEMLLASNYCGEIYRPDVDGQQERRDAFRRLMAANAVKFNIEQAFGGSLKQEILHGLLEGLIETLNDPGIRHGPDFDERLKVHAESMLRRFDEILQKRWHLVEPTQIITFQTQESRGNMSSKERQYISLLLSQNNLSKKQIP